MATISICHSNVWQMDLDNFTKHPHKYESIFILLKSLFDKGQKEEGRRTVLLFPFVCQPVYLTKSSETYSTE